MHSLKEAIMKIAQEELKKAFGPLWDVYNNDKVVEIIVDALDDVYYEEGSQIKNLDDVFTDSSQIETVIRSLAKLAGKTIDSDTYAINFAINETTKVMAVLPPLSLKGPAFNLIKIPKQRLTWDDLIRANAIDEEGRNLISDMLKNCKSILLAGSAGSGKTTHANILVASMPKEYRIVTIERTPELSVDRKRSARLQTLNNQPEEMLELVKVASKMRADYLILNEVQGPEVMNYLELLRDGNSGIALLSADNIFDSIKRLEFKAMSSSFAGSIDDLRYSISQAFDYIIFQEVRDNGCRVMSKIAKIKFDGGEIKLDVVYKR